MGVPWEDHEHWVEQLREYLGDVADGVDDDDLMFISNVAAQTMQGKLSVTEGLHEIDHWRQAKMGFNVMLDRESFELEMQVNYPDLIDVTEGFKDNMIRAGEEGIADGIVQLWAHPEFPDNPGGGSDQSYVAMQCKAWFLVHHLNHEEHHTMGWAIHQAVVDHVG